jgi:hypothetical protein
MSYEQGLHYCPHVSSFQVASNPAVIVAVRTDLDLPLFCGVSTLRLRVWSGNLLDTTQELANPEPDARVLHDFAAQSGSADRSLSVESALGRSSVPERM